RQPEPFEDRRRLLEVVPVPVVERDREVSLERRPALEQLDERIQRDDIEVAAEEQAVLLERIGTYRQASGIRLRVDMVERNDDARVAEQHAAQARREHEMADDRLHARLHGLFPASG